MSEESDNTGDQISEAAAPVVESGNEFSKADRQVPLDALQAVRAEKQQLQDQLKMMQDHMSLLHSNQSQSKNKSEDDFEGMSEDDVLTVKEFKQAFGKKEKQFQLTLQEMQISQKYPDYQQVVTQYLPEIIKKNPGLRNTLQSSNDFELAYYLAKNSDEYKQNHKNAKKNADAERIVQNANRAGSLSSVGKTSPINDAKRFAQMSDEEFKKNVQKNLGYY